MRGVPRVLIVLLEVHRIQATGYGILLDEDLANH